MNWTHSKFSAGSSNRASDQSAQALGSQRPGAHARRKAHIKGRRIRRCMTSRDPDSEISGAHLIALYSPGLRSARSSATTVVPVARTPQIRLTTPQESVAVCQRRHWHVQAPWEVLPTRPSPKSSSLSIPMSSPQSRRAGVRRRSNCWRGPIRGARWTPHDAPLPLRLPRAGPTRLHASGGSVARYQNAHSRRQAIISSL